MQLKCLCVYWNSNASYLGHPLPVNWKVSTQFSPPSYNNICMTVHHVSERWPLFLPSKFAFKPSHLLSFTHPLPPSPLLHLHYLFYTSTTSLPLLHLHYLPPLFYTSTTSLPSFTPPLPPIPPYCPQQEILYANIARPNKTPNMQYSKSSISLTITVDLKSAVFGCTSLISPFMSISCTYPPRTQHSDRCKLGYLLLSVCMNTCVG